MAGHAHDLTAPNLTLPGVSGGTFNPADFRGQRLALFLCPDDPEEAAREIEGWRALVDHFQDAGVWLLGIAHDRVPEECLSDKAGRHIAIARDSTPLAALSVRKPRWRGLAADSTERLWTDDYSNVIGAMGK